jgi:hypothetical protein
MAGQSRRSSARGDVAPLAVHVALTKLAERCSLRHVIGPRGGSALNAWLATISNRNG